jgi:hypothetical protein
MHPRSLIVRSSRLHWFAAAATTAAIVAAAPAEARVTRIVIDEVAPLTGQAIPYEQIRGRAFGELDPNDPHNGIVTDIKLGADADGKVRYETTFNLVKPVEMNRASGFLWHDVPNRGGAGTLVVDERELGDIGLRSGWQADNAGNTGIPANRAAGTNHWVAVPIAKVDGLAVTGKVFARIVNQGGAGSQPLMVQANPVPYFPATLDTAKATLKTHTRETVDGVVTEGPGIAAGDWAFAKCDAGNPFPGTPIDNNPANAPRWCTRHTTPTSWAWAWRHSATSAPSSATRRPTTSARAIRWPASSRARRCGVCRSPETWCGNSSSWA